MRAHVEPAVKSRDDVGVRPATGYRPGAVRNVAPFPLASLPRVARKETLVLRRLARALDAAPLERAAADLAPLLGGALRIEPVPLERWPAGAMSARADVPLVAIVVGDALAGPAARLALELDADLGGLLVDRALGALDAEPRLASGPASEGERGVLSYVAARALASAGGRLRVLGVVTATASLAAAVGDGALSAWPARLSIGPVVGWARLWIPDAWSPPAAPPAPTRAGALEIELALVAGMATLSARELASLERGDVLVPDELSITRAPLGGEVSLVAAHGGPAFRATLRDEGTLVLGSARPGTAAALGGPPRATVAAAMQTPEPLGDAVNDVPVEVRVEIGRVIVRVADLAALRPGEILTTGSPVGERVVLRAAGEIVATGELCDVEGELGVRIVALTRR